MHTSHARTILFVYKPSYGRSHARCVSCPAMIAASLRNMTPSLCYYWLEALLLGIVRLPW